MEKFKKIFRLQLKWLPIIGFILIISGSIIYEIYKNSFKEVSYKEFLKIAIDNKNNSFTSYYFNHETDYLMEVKSGKYSHTFHSDEEEQFEEDIIYKINYFQVSSGFSFYLYGIPIILGVILFILLFNFIILWFVVFYDLLKSEFKENHNKWIWFISLFLFSIVAPIFYLYISKNQKK